MNSGAVLYILCGLVVGCLWLSSISQAFDPAATSVDKNADPAQSDHYYRGLSAHETSPFLETDPHICVVVRTYKEHKNVLGALIHTLAANNYPHMNMFLLDTEDTFADLPKFAELYNMLYNKDFVHVSNVTRANSRAQYPQIIKHQDYGYLQTDLQIQQLQTQSQYKCDYFLATNGDNIYSKDYLFHTIKYLRQKIDLVGVYFLTHYCWGKADWPNGPQGGCYAAYYSAYMPLWLDLGASLMRAERMRQFERRFILHDLINHVNTTDYQMTVADIRYFEYLVNQPGTTSIIVNTTLFVHQ